MGEVYRARDTKLGRDVALKVLPESLARDPERIARFEREAHVLASLNHPNIATVYGFEAGAIGMELVEGPTLAERIGGLTMALNEALPMAERIIRRTARNAPRKTSIDPQKPGQNAGTPGF
jgi:eukaryotic-like serine/threonine-protein kinase